MSDCLCEDYNKAKASRERQAKNASNPYYWWEMPDPFEAKATSSPVNNSNGLARSRRELKERRQKGGE